MAGAGYKLFQTGDVLTAAQVNTYLNEQTVMVFANAAARTSALTSVLAEGMVSYLQDTNAVEVYNGSAWVGVSGAGDVTEVQAGTGISVASGTGPIPVVTNTMATTIDAKGDLVVGTGADTFARLAVGGTNGHSLQVDSSTATGLKWAAAGGGSYTLINTGGTTLTGSSVTVSSIPGTYKDLYILVTNYDPATDDAIMSFYVNSDNGTKYANATAALAGSFNTTSARLVYAQDNGTSNAIGYTFIRGYAENTWKIFDGVSITNDKTTPTNFLFSVLYGLTNITAAVSSVTFINDSGNFSGGTVYVYGVN